MLSIFVRTRQELQDVVEANPFAAETAQAMDRIYYTLLASPPDTGRLQALHALDTGADRVQVVGQALYTLYATRHSDSRLNNNFYERQLRLAATTRNFNTLTRLIELSICFKTQKTQVASLHQPNQSFLFDFGLPSSLACTYIQNSS